MAAGWLFLAASLAAAPAGASWLGTTPEDFEPKGPPQAIYRLEIPAEMPPRIKRLVLAMYAMHPNQRGGAVLELWKTPDQAGPAIPWLIALLGDQERATSRRRRAAVGLLAARLLEELGRRAVPQILAALEREREPFGRAMMLRVLGEIGDPRALEPILKHTRFPRPPKKDRKKRSLVQIAPVLHEQQKEEPAPPPMVRAQAVKALTRYQDPRVAAALVAALGDPHPEVRAAAAKTLAKRGDPEALAALMAAAKDKFTRVRRQVFRALKYYQDRRAVGVFLAGLKDPDAQVRQVAAEALGAIRDIRAAGPLLAAVKDPDPRVREAAIDSLQYYNHPAAVRPLAAALEDKDNGVRAKAALVLGPLGLGPVSDPEAVAALVRATRDPHPKVRRNAVLALKYVKGPQALEALLAAAQDGYKPARVHAINNLGFINDPRAVAALVKALNDPEPEVRQRAAEGLGRLKARKSIKPLIEVLDDPERRVREAAADALQVITGWRYGMDQAGWRKWYQRHR